MTCSTPVVLLIFRRPDLTALVFEAIRQAQPTQLLVVADGPRHADEAELCQQARAVTEQVDWDCEVLRNYADVNLGCRKRVSSGLDWAFEQVEEAIVLEDDCLPHPSFFRYCQELLERYRDDERVWCISGNNFQKGQRRGDASYYFSNYNHCWGWASWRRAWRHYDRDFTNWSTLRDNHYLAGVLDSDLEVQYWQGIFERLHSEGKPDTWDYAWTFTCWQNRGLTALPNVNLISNLGFGIEATHTLGESEFAMMPVADIGELQHPTLVARDKFADMYTFETCFLGSPKKTTRNCWCGNSELIPFGPDYLECRVCGTLVSQDPVSYEELIVKNDETDFYGKEYWFRHQTENFGFPDIYTRARNDLTERNLHWLKTLLKYSLPPAQVLELGCSHGSFVALLQQVGYQASGVEMSPWVVTYAHETFQIPVSVGPVENLNLPENSLDVIVLMDVMEHLPDPLTTIEHCLNLLKPDGLLLIQMPEFQEGKSYESLSNEGNPFLNIMLPKEHIYLFSQRSVKNLFGRFSIQDVYFEPAIFDQYDMFLIAAKQSLKTHSLDEIELNLLRNSSSRMILGMLDLRQRELEALNKVKQLESDISKVSGGTQALSQELETRRAVENSEQQIHNQLQSDLQVAQARIKAMESSKFWKLRRKWMGFKQKLGFNSKE